MRKSNVVPFSRLLLSGAALAAILSVVAPAAYAGQTIGAAAPSGVERIIATEDIRQLKYQWWADMDGNRWNAALALFASPDAPIDIGLKFPDGRSINTARQFVDFAPGFFGNRKGLHSGHNPIITFKSATEAEGTWQFDAVYWQEADGRPSGTATYYWGYHFDRYIKTPNGWRIAATRFEATSVPLGKFSQ